MVKIIDEVKKLLESVESPWLTSREACAYIKCSPSTLNRMVGLGKVDRYRAIEAVDGATKGWLYSKLELDEAIKKNRINVPEEMRKRASNYRK